MSTAVGHDAGATAAAPFGAGLLRQLSSSVGELAAGLSRSVSRSSDGPPSAASTFLTRTSSDDVVDCPVCIGSMRSGDLVLLCDAGHRICCPCALACIRDELQPGRTMVLCPFCKQDALRGARGHMAGWISEAAFLRVAAWSRRQRAADVHAVAEEEVLRFEERCASAALLSDGTPLRIVRCPHDGCGLPAAANVRSGTAPEVAQCPHCDRPLCATCGRRWITPVYGDGDGATPDAPLVFHVGMACDAYTSAIASVADSLETNPAVLGSSMAAGVKPCPSCGTGIVHARGHACHHIKPGSGCPACKTHFCFVCLGAYPCGNGCPTFCDDTCDCAPCLECTPTRPCAHCDGDSSCVSCHPVPQHMQASRAATAAAARATKMARGWCGPRRVPPTRAYTGALGITLGQVQACVTALRRGSSPCAVECSVHTLCSMAGTRDDVVHAHIVASGAIACMCDAVERLPDATAAPTLRAALQCISGVMTRTHARTCVCEQAALAIVMRVLSRVRDDADTIRRALDVLARAAAAAGGDDLHVTVCTSVWSSIGGARAVCAHVDAHATDSECVQSGCSYVRDMLRMTSDAANDTADLLHALNRVFAWILVHARDVNAMCALVAVACKLLDRTSGADADVRAAVTKGDTNALAVYIGVLDAHADRVEDADNASAVMARRIVTVLTSFQPWLTRVYVNCVTSVHRAGVRSRNAARAGVVISLMLGTAAGMLALPARDWISSSWAYTGVNTALLLAFAGSYQLLKRTPRYTRIRQEIRTTGAGWAISVGVLSAMGWLMRPGGYTRSVTDFCRISWLAWTAAYTLPVLISIATLSDVRLVWNARNAAV